MCLRCLLRKTFGIEPPRRGGVGLVQYFGETNALNDARNSIRAPTISKHLNDNAASPIGFPRYSFFPPPINSTCERRLKKARSHFSICTRLLAVLRPILEA